ncbi:N-acetylgalactosamine-N,N'-diacetylbacillosaminyl-diphospho-undecaprenol 4-alpha-N-acetylgalactosaminyltransferase [soil metagenome]
MHRKKIAILINSLYAGGAERVVANMLFTLSDEFDVHLLLLRDEIDYPIPAGQKIDFLSSERMGGSEAGVNLVRLPLIANRLRNYCAENEIELVISFLNRPNLAAGLAKILGLRAKVVMSERVYTPLFYDKATLRGKIGGRLISWLYRYADAIVPNSEGTKNALVNIYGIKSKYFVATNQISLRETKANKIEAVSEVQFNCFTFICVAGFREQKNHKLLIEAFANLHDQNAKLLLIGKGPTLQDTRDFVAKLGLTESVVFLGHQSNPHKYIAKSQCFVLPSDFEGFPNVLLEALACGVPVISTDCLTGPRELLAPSTTGKIPPNTFLQGDYGMLVPVSDVTAMTVAMSEMATDSNLRKRYSSAAVRRALDFDQDTRPNPFRYVIASVIEGRDFESQ